MHFNFTGYTQSLKQYQAQVLDEYQADQNIERQAHRAEEAIKVKCPYCGNIDTIGLFPVDDYESGPTQQWECVNCFKDIDEKWLESEFQKRGMPLLTCARCGDVYLMSVGHECRYGEAELNGLIGILSFTVYKE